MNNYNLYWGEIHTHTYCGQSRFGSLQEAVEIARTHLDFWAPGEHNNSGKNRHSYYNWDEIIKIAKVNNNPGEFVVFPGFEYAIDDGDYNAYFCQDDIDEFFPTNLMDLFNFVKKYRGIAIPHHTGYKVRCRGTDWDNFQKEIMPLVEIYSMHGSSESEEGYFPMTLPWMGPRATAGTVQAGLSKGLKFGFIASSDGHYGYPGCYKMGLLAAYAKELTRESVWEAFLNRRTYAVTGDRIELMFSINGHIMGEEITCSDNRTINMKVIATDIIDKVEIIKNNRIIYRADKIVGNKLDSLPQGKYRIRIEWGWGGEEVIKWSGRLNVSNGKILSIYPCFGPPAPNRILFKDEKSCEWLSYTQGSMVIDWSTCRNGREGTNSIVFEMEGNEKTVLELVMNSHKFKYDLKQLLQNSQIELMRGPFDEKIKIYQPIPEELYTFESEVKYSEKENNTDFYYVRVTQMNGQMAWSSPIWINSK